MDLAKIRKKSLLTPKEPDTERVEAPAASPLPVEVAPQVAPIVPFSAESDCFQTEPCCTVATFTAAASPFIAPQHPDYAAPALTPLEAILAGRTAAGCNDESILADEETGGITFEACFEFLCFRVSDEIYGINIMDIKELIKPREVTEVPRAPAFVSGVLSLRGTIIPIIDMRVRLGLAHEEPTGKERIVVIRTSNSLSGLLVDEVIQVVKVQQDAIEAAPAVLDGIDRDFISGLGRADGKLIIILNLETIADINLC
ncbi:MAG: chemotaxis protein CheW [Desulfuromonadaceae bacterium]|nr:chemotaxis protein CheW [Desulfuromonadaceae bacterium]MDD2850248.1 chemotaxis protein CheW [Desulfuromonadaceae bacterium]MDD4129367.1 chemotaxis protein CheW [Desulfuromonadaceae bacterium]